MAGILFLLEDLLCEHRQIDAPVAPDVTTIGLYIFILVALAIPVGTQIDSALIEEISITHTHPIELGLAGKEACALLFELRIGLNLLSKRILVTALG